jgi:sulfur carrier protein
MLITVNGEKCELAGGATVASVVASLAGSLAGGTEARGVAVAVAGAIVPRSAWARTELRDGARVEVLTAVQGG